MTCARDARRHCSRDHHAARHRRARAGTARRAGAGGHGEELAVEADDGVSGVDGRRDARAPRGRVPQASRGGGVSRDPAARGVARNEYLPKARTTDGFGALPGGERMYRFVVRDETTTDLTPDEIHELGLKEVKRIQPAYSSPPAEKAGFKARSRDVRRAGCAEPGELPVHDGRAGDRASLTASTRASCRSCRSSSAACRRRAFEIRLTDPALAAIGAGAVLPAYRRRPPGHLRDAGARPRRALDLRPRGAARARRHARPPFRRRHQAREQGARVPPPACG